MYVLIYRFNNKFIQLKQNIVPVDIVDLYILVTHKFNKRFINTIFAYLHYCRDN